MSTDEPVAKPPSEPVAMRACRCAEAPEAWRKCPLPQHDHARWTEHGWNCPASCQHPDALSARRDSDDPAHYTPVEE